VDRSVKDEVRARIVADAASSGVDLDVRVICEIADYPCEEIRVGPLDTLDELDLVAFWINGRLDSVYSVGKDPDLEDLCVAAAERASDLISEELAGRRASNWPPCPVHPNSHPLQPTLGAGGGAVWTCPRGDGVAVPIGQLGAQPAASPLGG
jgi:hypothetical protein